METIKQTEKITETNKKETKKITQRKKRNTTSRNKKENPFTTIKIQKTNLERINLIKEKLKEEKKLVLKTDDIIELLLEDNDDKIIKNITMKFKKRL